MAAVAIVSSRGAISIFSSGVRDHERVLLASIFPLRDLIRVLFSSTFWLMVKPMQRPVTRLSRLEKEWPQTVPVAIPPGGFGWRFKHLLWAAKNCGSPRHWEDSESLVFAFYDQVDTGQFREWLESSQINWRCPPEWPQVEPEPPLGSPEHGKPIGRLDPEELSDWVRGALRRGHAKRVIGAYLKGNRRSTKYSPDGALPEAVRVLAELRPDIDPDQHRPLVQALCAWTLEHHGRWFTRQLEKHERNQ